MSERQCVNCGEVKKIQGKDRCSPCYKYLWKCGRDREFRRCSICDDPINVNNDLGICQRNPQCKAARFAIWYETNRKVEWGQCEICSRPIMSDSKYGVCSQTRECRAEQVKRAYKANPGKFRKRSILYRQNNAQAVYEANRRWRAANPDKVREMKSRERERNAVRHRERKKRYYQNNRDKIRDRQRAWYAANPEARRRAVERVRQWNEENPERARLNSRRQVRKRRTLRESLPFIPFDESALLDQYGYCCYLCSKPLDLTDIHWDHAVPLSKGGWTVPENMRPTHPACNMSKSDKLEWNHETYSTIYAMLSAGGWEGYAVTLKHGEFRTEPVTHATLADAA